MPTWLVGISSLLVTTAAHAQPGLERDYTVDPPSATPHVYVSTDAILGGSGGHTGVGLGADIGVHVYRALWIHAGASSMDTTGGWFGGDGTFKTIHAGLELSTCHTGDRICAYAGGDLGWAHSDYWESDWFDNGGMGYSHDSTVGVIRAGLDIGGKYVRWRPGFEATLGAANGGGVTNSLVVQF